jgi:hypothetical protein
MKANTYFNIFFLMLLPFVLSAQRNLTLGGGEFKGEGGSLSQSFGQLSYALMSSAEISVSEGVIQVFEIAVISGFDNNAIQLFYKAYPNPVTENLCLEIENYQGQNLEYQLFDNNGRLIEKGAVTNTLTSFSTLELIAATYYLHVLKEGKSEKSFKIVKI